MRQGAADYLVKPFEPKALIALVARHALGRLGPADSEGPIAVEPASIQLLNLASRVAKSDSTVLISGESGTGKEVLARFIHQHSPRADKPFIAINCAAIPDNMLEATLFGHEKGSFTGAIAAQAGKFEQAEGGTILLDEISEMPMALQAKLLRVSSVLARANRSFWTYVSWPPPTAIWRAKWRRGAFVRICFIACRCFRWRGRPCVKGLPIFCRWPSACWPSTSIK